MAISRYQTLRRVKTYSNDPVRLETFPPLSESILSNIPHTVVKFQETDRLDYIAERFLGDSSYWWAICLMNNLENPFSYKLLPGALLKIPNDVDHILKMIQLLKNA